MFMKFLPVIAFSLITLTTVVHSTHAATLWEDVTPVGAGATTFQSVVSIFDYAYLATDSGIYLSTDAADSWTEINTGLGNTDVRKIAVGWVFDFAAQGGFGGYVFSSTTPVIAATANGIYTTTVGTDLNPTWVAATGLTDTNVLDIEFDTYETNDGFLLTNTVYAATPSGVFRSDDNGATWTLQNTGMEGESVKKIATSWINGTIHAVTASNKVYVSDLYSFSGYTADESWTLDYDNGAVAINDINLLDPDGGIMWLATDDGILKSDGFGTNWSAVNTGLGGSAITTVSSDYAGDINLAYAASPTGGVFRTDNEALGTPPWLPINTGLTNLNINDVQTNAGTVQYVYAVSDAEVFRLTVTGSPPPYPDMTPPGLISDLTASTTSSTAVDLQWTAPGDDLIYGTATSYDVRYATTTLTEGNWASAVVVAGIAAPQVASTTESLSVTGLDEGTTYFFGIKTTDDDANESELSNVAQATTITPVDVTPPTVPSGIIGTSTTATQTELSWTASTDAVGVSYYSILRSTSSNPLSLIATTSNLLFTDTDIEPITEYTYVLTAHDAAGNISATSSTVVVNSIPSTPTGFSATSVSTSQIDLAWSSTTESISGYRIYRNGTVIATTTSSTTSFSDTGLSAATLYPYEIRAFESNGYNSLALGASATTLSNPTSSGGGGGGGGGGGSSSGGGGGGGGSSSRTSSSDTEDTEDSTPTTTSSSADNTEESNTTNSTPSSVLNTSSAQPPYTFRNTLSPDETNSEVRRLQVALNALGYTVSDSGVGSPGNESEYYGAKTTSAIQAFQRAAGIVSAGTPETTGYGNFGPSTQRALNNAYAAHVNRAGGSGSNDDSLLREFLLRRIAELTALVAALTQQYNSQQSSAPVSAPMSVPNNQTFTFTKPLNIGDDNADVKRLQQKLNSLGILVATEGDGSVGRESTYFGPRTTTAIQKFQCTYNIVCGGTPETSGYGNFGPKTRDVMNSL